MIADITLSLALAAARSRVEVRTDKGGGYIDRKRDVYVMSRSVADALRQAGFLGSDDQLTKEGRKEGLAYDRMFREESTATRHVRRAATWTREADGVLYAVQTFEVRPNVYEVSAEMFHDLMRCAGWRVEEEQS